jgi:hypothetical protein
MRTVVETVPTAWRMPTAAVAIVTVVAMTVVTMVPMRITMARITVAMLHLDEIGGRRRRRQIQGRHGKRGRLNR